MTKLFLQAYYVVGHINEVKVFASFMGTEYDEDSEMEIHPAINTHMN